MQSYNWILLDTPFLRVWGACALACYASSSIAMLVSLTVHAATMTLVAVVLLLMLGIFLNGVIAMSNYACTLVDDPSACPTLELLRLRSQAESLANQRVQCTQLRVAARRPPLEHLPRPQQPHLSGRRLAVTHARLRRANRERHCTLSASMHRHERARLRWVAERRARSVRLHSPDIHRHDRCATQSTEQERALR